MEEKRVIKKIKNLFICVLKKGMLFELIDTNSKCMKYK